MKKYVFLNPVIGNTFPRQQLEQAFSEYDFSIIDCQKNWPQIVKEKYQQAAASAISPIVDQRCPVFAEQIKTKDPESRLTYPKIEPIFLHAAREIASRPELEGHQKWIVAPCTPLVILGERLNLPETTFITWNAFLAELVLTEHFTKKAETPIPLGFFDELNLHVKGLTGPEAIADFSLANFLDAAIIEGLYCKGGCHNGDGMV